MELDELKNELRLKIEAASEPRSENQIASLLKQDAVSIVQKLRKSLRAELIVSAVFVFVCLYMMLFKGDWMYRVFFTTFFIIGIVFSLVLFLLLKKTATMPTVGNVRYHLQQLIHLMDEYVKRYLQLTLILLPVCFVFGVWISYNNEDQVLQPLAWRTIIYLSLAMFVLGAAVYFFTKWYLRSLYGKYIRQMKGLLRELDEPSK